MSQYLIINRSSAPGLFWCPKSSGYTPNILQAGVYSQAEAQQFLDGRSNHSEAIPLESRREEIESAIARLNSDVMTFAGYTVSEYPGDPRYD